MLKKLYNVCNPNVIEQNQVIPFLFKFCNIYTDKHKNPSIGQKFFFKVNTARWLTQRPRIWISSSVNSVAQECLTLCDLMDVTATCLSPTQVFTQIHVYWLVMPSSHFILCRPLLLLPLIFPSIWVFSNESPLHIRWPKYWSFSVNISPSNEHSGPITFRMDRLDFLAVQGTLKSLLQHHSSKASILRCSAFFTVQLLHPCMNTGKKHSLD